MPKKASVNICEAKAERLIVALPWRLLKLAPGLCDPIEQGGVCLFSIHKIAD
jgi:hypothetical protein